MSTSLVTSEAGWPTTNLGQKYINLFKRVFRDRPAGLELITTLIEAQANGMPLDWLNWIQDNFGYASRENADAKTLVELLTPEYLHVLQGSFPKGSAGRRLADAIAIAGGARNLTREERKRGLRPYGINVDSRLMKEAVVESLGSLPPGTDLSALFSYWLKTDRYLTINEPQLKALFDAVTVHGQPVLDQIYANIIPLVMGAMGAKSHKDRFGSLFGSLFDNHAADFAGLYDAGTSLKVQRQHSKLEKIVGGLFNRQKTPDTEGWRRIKAIGKVVDLLPDPFDSSSYEKYLDCRLSHDVSTLPVEVIEGRLLEIAELVEEGFELGYALPKDGIEGVYHTLGSVSGYEPANKLLGFLRKLKNRGDLSEIVLHDVASGLKLASKPLSNTENVTGLGDGAGNLASLVNYTFAEQADGRLLANLIMLPEGKLVAGLYVFEQLRQRDEDMANLLLRGLPGIDAIFRDKYDVIVGNFEKDRSKNNMRAIANISNIKSVADALGNINLQTTGKAQANRLIHLAALLDALVSLNIPERRGEYGGVRRERPSEIPVPEGVVTKDLKQSYHDTLSALKDTLAQVGLEYSEHVMQFIPFIRTRDPHAIKGIRGELVKTGVARSYEISNSGQFNVGSLEAEVLSYAKMADIRVDMSHPVDIAGVKGLALYVLSEARKKNLLDSVAGEVMPNLDRIITSTTGAGSYMFVIDPQDITSQMKALQNVQSCLSPGGSMFEHTSAYLSNPNTFWATIQDKQGAVVGRTTIFIGTTPKGESAFARVSSVYSQVPISVESVDAALQQYSLETGMKLIRQGKLIVEGINEKSYDDHISGFKDGAIFVDTTSKAHVVA